ncbi:conjugal transfer protein [Streptomyces sp. NPDC127190]|uniref:conjugal transfer protein n=1 Tax=unclassified Streptomyces TaxID=2593676 RepID=UPI0036402127
MTDQNSSAGAVGAGQPSGQPGSFGAPHAPQQAQAPQAAWPAQGQQAPQAQPQQPQPQPQPQPMASDAARAQVAAAWVRSQPRASQATVPALPPRETTPRTESKKEKRDRERAARKAAYEQKKAAKQGRKNGGAKAPAAPAPTSAQAPAVPVQAQPQPYAPAPAHAAVSSAPAQTTAPAAATSSSASPSASAPASASMSASADKASATEAAAPTPARAFDVPKPGGRIPSGGSGGRRTHVALRATLLVTTCVLALGSCGVMGLMVGVSARTTNAALDQSDAARYRLTDFPVQQAATFAEQYALLCLTYSPEKDSDRRDKLAHYASAGVDPECGWNGQGTSTAVSAVWDGTIEDLPEYGDHGRYLGVQVRTADGTLTELTVPVYVKDLKSGEGMRVAGDVGQMPLPARADAPEVNRNHEVVDDKLAAQLKQQVLPGYFTAWGASDSTAMARFTAPGATLAATSGLAGRLSNPNVTDVDALVPGNVQHTDPYTYPDGQEVQLRVVVEWGDTKGQTVRRAYRMTVVNTAQGWFIKDIHGGMLDPQGGRADDGQSDSADSSDSPSGEPSASGSPSPSPSGTTVQSSKGKRNAAH